MIEVGHGQTKLLMKKIFCFDKMIFLEISVKKRFDATLNFEWRDL